MNNKVITTQGNVQFQFPDGKIVNVHPSHIYTVFNEDTVSFILVGLPKTSGLSTMTSKAEDLELNGNVYSFAELPNAVSEAFAIAGAQARCEIVDELPETGYTNTIYLVPQPAPQTGFDEYVYILDQGWELIGDTSIEMDNYVLKTVFSGYTADTAVVLNGLRTDVDTTSGNVITETERALLAESGLSDAISAEEAAREAADGVISGAVDTVSSGLTEEVERAIAAESGLSDAIDAVSGNVETETARAEGVENAISGALDTHIQDDVRHISGAERTSWNEKTKTISLTQSEYDALPSSAKTDATKLYVISDAQPIDLSVYAKASALTEEISARTDADTALDNKIDAVSAATDDALALKLDASAYTVDSSVIENSVNPVQGGALYDELRIEGETTLVFEGEHFGNTTNYPSGCTEIKVEVIDSNRTGDVYFYNGDELIGGARIRANDGEISVTIANINATYEISGSTVIISYPTVTNVTHLYSMAIFFPIKAVTRVTTLKDQVSANTTALVEKVNTSDFEAYSAATDDALALKLDASAYTVDSSVIENSVNPVQGGALYDELRIGGESSETILEWDNHLESTNYPSGCTEIKLEFTSEGSPGINFLDENYDVLGNVGVVYQPQQSIAIVDNTYFEDSSYEISGSTFTISYPSVTNVAKVYSSIFYNATVKAISNDPLIVLKDQVSANTTALVEKVNTSDFEAYSAATDSRLSEDEEVTAAAFNELNEALSGKQNTLSVGRGISISSNTISFDLPISPGIGSNSIVEGHSSNVASGEYSHAEGKTTKASGDYSHAEGHNTLASESYSHAEGYSTISNGGYGSHAEGYYTSAMTFFAHSEGERTLASGDASHAEGGKTQAVGQNSHAEGNNTLACEFSHSEGSETKAFGMYSHAEGYSTIANNQSEHTSGQYNVSSKGSSTFGDSGNTLFSVGNGTSTADTHNAFEIRQNGDIYFEYDGNDIKLQDKLDDIESVTAAAINNLNDKFGGLKLQQITQSAYDQLQTKDPNVLYVIVN